MVTREVMAALAGSSTYRTLTVLDLVAGMMGEAAAAQDQSAELFTLVHTLLATEGGREFLAARGFLSRLCGLISTEVMRIRAHESSSTSDIAQVWVGRWVGVSLSAPVPVSPSCLCALCDAVVMKEEQRGTVHPTTLVQSVRH